MGKTLVVSAIVSLLLVSCAGQGAIPTSSLSILAEPTLAATSTPTLIPPTEQPPPTPFPLNSHIAVSADAIEVIVYTWDWPMQASIPPIHIWKDGYAVWTTSHSSNNQSGFEWHVYETWLSSSEVAEIEKFLNAAHFWEYVQKGPSNPDVSSYIIWAEQSGRQKYAGVGGDENLQHAVAQIQNLLENAPLGKEYFPIQGCLYATGAESYLLPDAFPWPDDQPFIDFASVFRAASRCNSRSGNGFLIDGDKLATVWKAVQQGFFWIISRGTAYQYVLKIPGMSCDVEYDGTWDKCYIYIVDYR